MKANSTQSIQMKKTRRFVAKYVYTWDKVSPTFSLGVNSELIFVFHQVHLHGKFQHMLIIIVNS